MSGRLQKAKILLKRFVSPVLNCTALIEDHTDI